MANDALDKIVEEARQEIDRTQRDQRKAQIKAHHWLEVHDERMRDRILDATKVAVKNTAASVVASLDSSWQLLDAPPDAGPIPDTSAVPDAPVADAGPVPNAPVADAGPVPNNSAVHDATVPDAGPVPSNPAVPDAPVPDTGPAPNTSVPGATAPKLAGDEAHEAKKTISEQLTLNLPKWLRDMPPKTQAAIIGGIVSMILAATAVILDARRNRLNFKQLLKQLAVGVTSAGIAGSVTTYVALGFQSLLQNMVIQGVEQFNTLKQLVMGAGCETMMMGTGTAAQIAGALTGLLIGVIFDVGSKIHELVCVRRRHVSMLQFCEEVIGTMFTSARENAPMAAVTYGIAATCPMWATLLLIGAASVFVGQCRILARERTQRSDASFLPVAAELLTDAVLFVPRLLLQLVVAGGNDGDGYGGEYPEHLCCMIGYDLLTDPVCLDHYVVNREVAENRIRISGLNFSNGPATLADIQPMPRLKSIIERAAPLLH